MAKNFDDARRAREQATRDEREFTIGGDTFYAKLSVRPEALTRWDTISRETPLSEVLEITDQTILSMIENENGSHDRYRELRQREDDPLSVQDLLDLAKWLVETATGRPTEPPSDSSTPDETTGTTSTDDSSSKDTPPEPDPST